MTAQPLTPVKIPSFPATVTLKPNSYSEWQAFQELVQRGANMWPDAPPHIKELADILSGEQPRQDYWAQAGMQRPTDAEKFVTIEDREYANMDYQQVLEFHLAFDHPVAPRPNYGKADRRALRAKLLLEEVLEFIEAASLQLQLVANDLSVHPVTGINLHIQPVAGEEPNLLEMADALGDIRYVTDGANLVFGFPQTAILTAIHQSNMSKLGEDGKPVYREDGKILKGPNYKPPTERIAKILQKACLFGSLEVEAEAVEHYKF